MMNNKRLEKLLAKKGDKRTTAETNELVDILIESNTKMGKAILQLRDVAAAHKETIELLVGVVMPKEEVTPFGLIGLTPPKLELN